MNRYHNADESDQVDDLDHWIECPSCGSIDARLDVEPPGIFGVCPDCDNVEFIEYPEIVRRYINQEEL